VEILKSVSGLDPVVRRGPPRPGDVRDSLAEITAARNAFGFEPSTAIEDGLASYWGWAKEEFARSVVHA
jgi:UDP-glucose 4-epimerase